MSSPLQYFDKWYQEALSCPKIQEANAVNLATISSDGKPSNRIVLLKEYNDEGFVFYTNLNSKKGQDLKHNPHASMCFYWEALSKQIRIEGKVAQVSDQSADAYFSTRPLKSQIGAWASKQSCKLSSQAKLLQEVALQSAKGPSENHKRPPYWSGFCLKPDRMEFWQKGKYRLHKRVCYTLDHSMEWQRGLIYP